MKKILFLLLLTVSSYGQTLQNPTYGNTTTNTLKIKTPATVTSVNFLSTIEADGSLAKINPVNLPIPISVINALEVKTENSAGAIQGFALTNNGNGTVNIASGTAYLRATNDQYAPLVKYTIPEVTNLVLTDNANNFVLVDYNGGVPALTVTTNSASINTETNSIALVVSRVGNTLYYLSLVGQNVDANAKLRVRFLNQEGIRRLNGASIGFSARNLTLTSGVLASGLIKINTPAFNTNTPDTFTLVYNNGAAWTRVTAQTQVNNTQYNSAGVLTNLGNGGYRTDYVYLLPNNPSKLYTVMGTTSYANITKARTALQPESLPSELQTLGVLVGRLIIQRLGANISEVSSAFDVVFPNSPVPEHNALAGLQGGTGGDYQHITTAEKNGFEVKSNKVTSIASPNNTTYPTTQLLKNQLDLKLNTSEKGAANGVATLGADLKVLDSQIRSIAISDTFVVGSQAAQLALSSANVGDIAIRTDEKKSYILSVAPPSIFTNWKWLETPTDQVQTVNGQTGIVSLTTANIPDSTNKRYQTDAQQAYNDATSSIQTQLNGKQAAGSYEPAFSKNTAFNKNFGTTAGTVAEGNDSRINNGQTAYSWGNHAGLYLPLTGNAVSSTISNKVKIEDTRVAEKLPSEYTSFATSFDFTNRLTSTGADFKSVMTVKGWSSDYSAWQLIGSADSSVNSNLFFRTGVNNTWNTPRKIIHDGNFNTYSPTLTGSGASGTWGINVSGYATQLMLNYVGNLNDVTASGIYREENVPGAFSFSPTLNMTANDARAQIIIDRYGSGLKFRSSQSGTDPNSWTAWKSIWHDGNFNPASYLLLSGGALSGNLGMGVSPLSGGESSKWITADGITNYGGGFISSLGGVAKAFYYYDSGYATVSGNLGVGFKFSTYGVNKFVIESNGNTAVTGTLTASGGFFNSDRRLKNVIKRDGDVAYFTWKDKRDAKTHIGYIAQEVKKEFPDQVQKGTDGMLSVNYVEILVAKIQDLEKRVKELENHK